MDSIEPPYGWSVPTATDVHAALVKASGPGSKPLALRTVRWHMQAITAEKAAKHPPRGNAAALNSCHLLQASPEVRGALELCPPLPFVLPLKALRKQGDRIRFKWVCGVLGNAGAAAVYCTSTRDHAREGHRCRVLYLKGRELAPVRVARELPRFSHRLSPAIGVSCLMICDSVEG
jgi:hypothetical protein